MYRWLESAMVYADRRVIAILFLGFSSGLPIMLIATTLSTWLREEGVDKSTIGLFGFVFVPYTIKFIWAPLIDRLPIPPLTTLMGRRRGWLLLTQVCLIGVIWGLGQTQPGVDLWWTAFMAVMVAFFSASQDVVVDAFRIDSLPKSELGAGAGVYVLGYRIAMWGATAGALFAAEWYGWSAAYTAMALLMVVGIGTTVLVREPASSDTSLIDDAVIEEDKLARNLPNSVLDPLRNVAGSLLVIIVVITVVQPISYFFGLLSPYHGEWNAIAIFIAVGRLALVGAGVWVGLLLYQRRENAPRLAKHFALISLGWLLVELIAYAVPEQSAYFGEIYGWFLVFVVWLVSDLIVGLFGHSLGYADTVTSVWILVTGLWIKLFALIYLYGYFYFSNRAIANFGINSIQDEPTVHLWMRRAVIEPFFDFFKRNGIAIALIILGLISVFKASDAVLTLMANPFYIDVGFTKGQIAFVSKTFGLWMTLIGGLAGGIVVHRLGMARSMIIAVIVMAISNAMFALVATVGADALAITQTAIDQGRDLTETEIAARSDIGTAILPYFYLVIIIENVSGGLGTAVFVAFLSSLCNVHYSAVQYALLTSFMQMFAKFVIVPSSGFYADALGWQWFFMTSTLFAVPGLLFLWLLHRMAPDIESIEPPRGATQAAP